MELCTFFQERNWLMTHMPKKSSYNKFIEHALKIESL